jgi:hypothetical protein
MTRLPCDVAAALTTNSPSGWSTNSTSASDRSACLRRNAKGIVTCPVRVIFTAAVSRRDCQYLSCQGVLIHQIRLKLDSPMIQSNHFANPYLSPAGDNRSSPGPFRF